ncbi:MAG: DUF2130 domain-containing protein [Candidatus Poseidoniales archaeon]|nr:DUF2130 domain-containing protein [Candidatus Poseidoniales archaeon]
MSKEVSCPHCKQTFEMDAAGYADIMNQIRDAEFETEITQRLQSEHEKHVLAVKVAEAKIKEDSAKNITDKDKQIDRLKNELKASETDLKMAVNEASSSLDKKIMTLEHKVSTSDTEKNLLEKSLNESFNTRLEAKDEIIRMKDEEIDRVKDMKVKMSVKAIGENLEKWCEDQFNILRPSAFPNAEFEKDNISLKDEDEVHGTKGDYIFRESDSSGVEFVSIMFEMKDKMEDTKGEKNESHLKKLDQDRKKKKCEYAILVSMLEMDSELYNRGIVDMSHKYKKMYIVRPQHFIPLLTLIRNEAKKSLGIRNEMAIIKSQNYDIENFENKMLDFQEGFGKNVMSARTNFEAAIKDIDATIKKLEKIKSSLTTSSRQLRLANDKTQDLSIKKLTRNNPTMKDKFDDLKKK